MPIVKSAANQAPAYESIDNGSALNTKHPESPPNSSNPVTEAVVPHAMEEDEDCILIPQHIETIDLCNLPLPQPIRFLRLIDPNEVIEVKDSPAVQRATTGAESSSGKPLSDVKAQLTFDDSNVSLKSVEISCPICLESVYKRDPVSTMCGHLFCKKCLQESLNIAKKCPICKRSLAAKNSYHLIFLGA